MKKVVGRAVGGVTRKVGEKVVTVFQEYKLRVGCRVWGAGGCKDYIENMPRIL